MLDHAVVGAAVAIHRVGVVTRLLAVNNTIAAYRVALARIQAGKPWLDLTRLSTAVPVENVVVVALLA
jgi:hypothetical protein